MNELYNYGIIKNRLATRACSYTFQFQDTIYKPKE